MARRARNPVVRAIVAAALAVIVAAGAAAYVWREEILRTALDPKQPYQTYRPPPPPDYAKAGAWALLPRDPAGPAASAPPVDVFFVHSTTYDGGRDWNGPIGERNADRFLFRVVLPNDAGPFQRVGRIFAPRYRQASLYASLTLRDDARDARRFAYGDVKAAFLAYLGRYNAGRPFILAGVGQGAMLAARLATEMIAPDRALRSRAAAVYLIGAVVPAAGFAPGAPLPACQRRDQAGCVVAWASVRDGDKAEAARRLGRALVWSPDGRLAELGDRAALCVNPLTGGTGEVFAPAKLNLGAANATGMEWGLRPAFLPHQVSARCQGGLLRVSQPASPSLQPSGSWADRRKAPAFNLFYADVEADAQARVDALFGRRLYGPAAPPIDGSTALAAHPVHRID